MFAIAPPVINSTAFSPSPAALATPVVDAVSTRQAVTALSAPLSNATPAVTAGGVPSTPFLTQAISQNASAQEDSQIGLSSSFAHFLPAPRYNQLVGYSIVRYRPSDAGLPSSYYANEPTDTSDESGAGGLAADEYSAYNTTQVRNLSNLANTEPQISTAG